ncbi:MAG: PspC domain-containing protein [Romboutsia sp.]
MKKRLYRSDKNKMICGVCGGISEYYNINVTLVRILFIIGLVGIPLYIYLLLTKPIGNNL